MIDSRAILPATVTVFQLLRSIANYLLSRVRPGKRIAQDVTELDLAAFLTNQFFCLMRGTSKSLLCRHAVPCFMGRGVRLRFARRIHIGRLSVIGEGTILSGLGRSGLLIGDKVNIGAYSRLVVGTDIARIGTHIRIGNNSGIGEYSSIGGSGGVEIGENTIIGQYFSAHPENHNFAEISQLIRDQGTTRAPITIGDDCWIGARVTVLAGVSIGKGSVVAAGSVVTRDLPPWSISAGIPARVLRNRKADAHDRP